MTFHWTNLFLPSGGEWLVSGMNNRQSGFNRIFSVSQRRNFSDISSLHRILRSLIHFKEKKCLLEWIVEEKIKLFVAINLLLNKFQLSFIFLLSHSRHGPRVEDHFRLAYPGYLEPIDNETGKESFHQIAYETHLYSHKLPFALDLSHASKIDNGIVRLWKKGFFRRLTVFVFGRNQTERKAFYSPPHRAGASECRTKACESFNYTPYLFDWYPVYMAMIAIYQGFCEPYQFDESVPSIVLSNPLQSISLTHSWASADYLDRVGRRAPVGHLLDWRKM